MCRRTRSRAIIDAECAHDDALRAAVVRLMDRLPRVDTDSGIVAHSATDVVAPIVRDLGDATAVDIADAPDIAEALLPRYVLHGELGRGGHAIVVAGPKCQPCPGCSVARMSGWRAPTMPSPPG